ACTALSTAYRSRAHCGPRSLLSGRDGALPRPSQPAQPRECLLLPLRERKDEILRPPGGGLHGLAERFGRVLELLPVPVALEPVLEHPSRATARLLEHGHYAL